MKIKHFSLCCLLLLLFKMSTVSKLEFVLQVRFIGDTLINTKNLIEMYYFWIGHVYCLFSLFIVNNL